MNIYTTEQWEKDGTLKVKEGQIISPAVFYELLNSVPPTTYAGGFFQMGEAYIHNSMGEALYSTFKHVSDDEKGKPLYKYIGLHYAL